MKKLLFMLLSVAALSTSCKKDPDVIPGSHVDSEALGKWMYGSFPMADFWSYDGSYAGKPFKLAVVRFNHNDTTVSAFLPTSW